MFKGKAVYLDLGFGVGVLGLGLAEESCPSHQALQATCMSGFKRFRADGPGGDNFQNPNSFARPYTMLLYLCLASWMRRTAALPAVYLLGTRRNQRWQNCRRKSSV